MDQLDREILLLLQNNFSVKPEPFKDIASILQMNQEEIIERVKKLKEEGIIRRLGFVFDSRRLGYKSTLCAMSVPEERLHELKDMVNAYSGVTHNYLRDHYYNMWFTLIAPSQKEVRKTIGEIEEKSSLKIIELPALKLFKIKVKFEIPMRRDTLVD